MEKASGSPAIHDLPGHLLALGLGLVDAGKGAMALGLIEQALAARPGDPLIAAISARIARHSVPRYHDRMLADHARNAAWHQAIAALAPGRVVLDIGTGSGLLAMMAARAGAAHVHACESDPMLAATARRVVADNGLDHAITIHAARSDRLDRQRDLGGGANLVISEILAHDLLGERVLPTLAHARAELCQPGALFVPEHAALRIALADVPGEPTANSSVEGFDLSAFARHLDPRCYRRLVVAGFALRSAAADLFTFDLGGECAMERLAGRTLASTGGRIGGVAQWLRIELGGGAVYENAPGSDPDAHWGWGFHPLAVPRDTASGEDVTVRGWHGESAIAIWG